MHLLEVRLPRSIYLPDAIDKAGRSLSGGLKITAVADDQYVSVRIGDQGNSKTYGEKVGELLNLALRFSIEATISSIRPEDE